MIDTFTPINGNVLIELPDFTGNHDRKHKSGLYLNFATTDEEKYVPVYGTIIKKSIRVDDVNIGDQVFFHYLTYMNAKAAATTWVENGKHYLIAFAGDLIFTKRGEEIVPLNKYVLLKSIPKDLATEEITDTQGNKQIIHFERIASAIINPNVKEKYRMDIAEVIAAPSFTGLSKGDIVCPAKDWDVPIEYDILETMGTMYYIEVDAIGAYIEDGKVLAYG